MRNNVGNEVSRMSFVSFSGSSINYSKDPKNSDFDLSDSDLILDARLSIKKEQPTKVAIIKKFKHLFDCDDEKAREILEANKALMKFSMTQVSSLELLSLFAIILMPCLSKQITNQIEYLFQRKVSIKSILDNSWLLCLSPSEYFPL